MKTFPNALEEGIDIVTKNIQTKIDSLAKQTEELEITDTEDKIQAITDFTKNIKDTVITVENDENEVVEILNPTALMTPEDIAL